MKLQILLIFVFIHITALGQESNPFLQLTFDRVVMYDYQPEGEKAGLIINSNGNLVGTVLKKAQLDTITIKQLNRKLGERKSFGGITASCFDPHLGIVYYLNDKVIAHVSICFACNRLRSSKDIPAQKQGKVGEGKDAYYIADGLSKSFRTFLNGLVKKHKFSHQIEPGSEFDK